MPIDVRLWNLVHENKAAVIAALIRRFDPSYGQPVSIYSPEGEWSYRRFEQWLAYAGVVAWPRLESGRLEVGDHTFRLIGSIVPGVEGLHALRDSIGFIDRARLPIGPDTSLFPLAVLSMAASGDLVLHLCQFISDLIEGGDQAIYWTDDAANRAKAFKLRRVSPWFRVCPFCHSVRLLRLEDASRPEHRADCGP